MEQDIQDLKEQIEKFIKKYRLKKFTVTTEISQSGKWNTSNPKEWIYEYSSNVNTIDFEMKQ